jgi:hypothetical protein
MPTLDVTVSVPGVRVFILRNKAHAAADELVDWLGFSNVTRKPDETVTASTPDTVPGFILTRAADLYGRCIALVGRGGGPQASGSPVFVDVEMLKRRRPPTII